VRFALPTGTKEVKLSRPIPRSQRSISTKSMVRHRVWLLVVGITFHGFVKIKEKKEKKRKKKGKKKEKKSVHR